MPIFAKLYWYEETKILTLTVIESYKRIKLPVAYCTPVLPLSEMPSTVYVQTTIISELFIIAKKNQRQKT